MQLILYIGTEKTGSTSIQEFLRNNRERLYEKKIYIPLSTMWGNGNQGWFRFCISIHIMMNLQLSFKMMNNEKYGFLPNLLNNFPQRSTNLHLLVTKWLYLVNI